MKKIIYFLLFLLSSLSLSAQTNVDSLVNVLNTQKLATDEELSVYKQLCNAYRNSDPEKLIKYAKKILELAIENKKDNYTIATSYYFIGIAYHTKADLDSAFIYYQKALNFALETNDKKTESSAYISIGFMYCDRSDYIKGLEYFMKALSIAESTNDIPQQINILANIGTTYRRFDNNDHALQYFEKVEKLAEQANSQDGRCMAYFNIGGICQDQGNMHKALEYELKALDISRSINHKPYEIGSLLSIAQVYYSDEFKEYDKAEKYATEGVRISETYGDPQMRMQSYATLADIYARQKRYKECDVVATKAWEIDTTNIVMGRDFIFSIVHANIFLGNKDKAAEYLDKLFEIVKKVNDENLHESLSEMEVKYETEKKEMRITALEEKQKLYMILGIAMLLALLSVIGLLFYRHRLSIQKRKMVEQQIKQLEQEKQLVATQAVLDGETAERSRLARDLHDGLGGMLSVVKLNLKDMKSYSIMENTDVLRFDKALNMLDQSIGELRRVAHHMMPDSLMRYGLKVSLEDFCRAIPGAQFQYFGTDERLDNRLEVMLYRCTYELVNNAVKHADASEINVQLMIEKGIVSLTVHDNGVGFDPETVTYGAGLENIRKRVSAYNGKMHIHSEPGNGTEINIEIELS